jgi:hypothetical protein
MDRSPGRVIKGQVATIVSNSTRKRAATTDGGGTATPIDGSSINTGPTEQHVESSNNLKWIGIAMFDYQEKYKRLPPAAIYSDDGKPLLSWRVAILPFLEQDALYRQFKLNEPWDSEHNRQLVAQMPAVYAAPGGRYQNDGTTFYQAFVGSGAAFDGREGLSRSDFLDGSSKTAVAAEASEAVPWTKPQDLSYSPDQPLPRLGGVFADGSHVLYADGTVIFVKKNVEERALRAVITRAGEESISSWDLEDTVTLINVGHPVYCVVFNGPGSPEILTGGSSNTVQRWSLATGKPIGEPLQHDGPVRSIDVLFHRRNGPPLGNLYGQAVRTAHAA